MSYRVRIENFEGPFDLLLYLVSRQKVDIGSVNITQIADQYLDEIAHMENLDLDVASDFLLVASTLLKIKAESLVNNDARELDEDVAELAPNEARDMLVDKLLVYKQFKSAAAALESRFEAESRMHPRMAPLEEQFANLTADYLDNATIEQLAVIARAGFSAGAGWRCSKASTSRASPFPSRRTSATSRRSSPASGRCASRSS